MKMIIKKKLKNKKGMSLLELSIVMVIIGIMTITSLAYLGNGRNDTRLKAAQAELSSNIKRAQSFALQGKAQAVPICGYGIKFTDNKNYQIFYQILGSASSCETKGKSYVAGDSQPLSGESYLLPHSIELDPFVSVDSTVIFFDLPHGNAYDSAGNAVNKTLTLKLGGKQRSLNITPGADIVEN